MLLLQGNSVMSIVSIVRCLHLPIEAKHPDHMDEDCFEKKPIVFKH